MSVYRKLKKTDFIKRYKKIVKLFIKNGFKANINICDFWFSNKNDLLTKLYKLLPVYGRETRFLEEFESRIRWESKLGSLFISEIQKKLQTPNIMFDDLNFQKIEIDNNGQKLKLLQFINNYNLKMNAQIFGFVDLRGISLKGIKIYNSQITNVNFSYSDFSQCTMQQCFLDGVIFNYCNFSKSYISAVRLSNRSHFSNSNVKNSYFYLVDNNNQSDIGKLYFNKITYFRLFRLLKINSIDMKKLKYSYFFFDEVDFYSENKKTQDYLLWFKNLTSSIGEMKEKNILENIGLILQIVLTKYWTSYICIIVFSVFICIVYGLVFFFHANEFVQKINTFFDSIYYSVICFTKLGGSDIIPNTDFAKWLVMTESIIGYIFLALIIFILSKKLSNKY